jgi:ribosome-binding factor A
MKIREKIKQLRKIRDDYKDFKIGLVNEVPDDIHQKRSKRYLLGTIEKVLNDSSQSKV